jgi:hypothetical protein
MLNLYFGSAAMANSRLLSVCFGVAIRPGDFDADRTLFDSSIRKLSTAGGMATATAGCL